MATLISMIPGDFTYCISKVYEGIYNDYPLTKMNFDLVKETCKSIKTEIDNRFGQNKLSGIKEIYRQIDYVLDKLELWINSKTIHGNLDAEVFMDAFKGYFTELEGMLGEIDRGEVTGSK